MAQTNRFKRILSLVAVLVVIIVVHTLTSSMTADMKDKETAQAELSEESSIVPVEPSVAEESAPLDKESALLDKESFSAQLPAAYKAYSVKGFKEAWQVMAVVAEDIYQEELAEGDTDDEFKLYNYIIKAIDCNDERMTSSVQLALLLPLLLLVMIVIAIILSIRSGLAAIRPLDFDNDAAVFNN